MYASAMYEVFYEVIASIIERLGEILETFRSNLMPNRAAIYAKEIEERVAAHENCVGFIVCT